MNTVKTPAGIPAYGLIRIDAVDLHTAEAIATMAGIVGFEYITWVDMFREMAKGTDQQYPAIADYSHAPTVLYVQRNVSAWIKNILVQQRSVVLYGINDPDCWSKLAYLSYLVLHDNGGRFRVARRTPKDVNVYPEGEWINPTTAIPILNESIAKNIKTNQDIRASIPAPASIHKGNYFELPSGKGYVIATQAGFKNAVKAYCIKHETTTPIDLTDAYPEYYPCVATFGHYSSEYGGDRFTGAITPIDKFINTHEADIGFVNNFKISRKLPVTDADAKAAMLQERIRELEILVANIPVLESQLKEMEDRLIEISMVMAKSEAA